MLHRVPAAAPDSSFGLEFHKPHSNQKTHLWPRMLPVARPPGLSSPVPFQEILGSKSRRLLLQWQSSLHSEDDRCWVLLPAPLGLPGPAQGPHALLVSPFPLGVPIPAQGPQALKHSAAPFLPAVLKPQSSQKSPFDGWM